MKERKRNEEMNQAYEQLQKCVPHIPNDQKLPKIKTLRLALRYIKHLQDVLKGSEMVYFFLLSNFDISMQYFLELFLLKYFCFSFISL